MKNMRIVFLAIFVIMIFIIAFLYMAFLDLRSQNDNLMRNFTYLDKRINGLENEFRAGALVTNQKQQPVKEAVVIKPKATAASEAPVPKKASARKRTTDNAPGNKGFITKDGK